MKSLRFGMKFVVLCASMVMIAATSIDASYGRTFGKSKGFALVELYTSEGCNSCPKAEKYLSEIMAIAQQSNEKIYCLSFHVNYWDYLGWVDKNASPSFTKRQIKYGQKFNKQGVFTPQVIVNGQDSHVGTLRSKIKKSIGQALGRKPKTGVSIDHFKDGDRVKVMYKIKKVIPNASLYVAIVKERELVDIRAGENKGITMEHRNVVKRLVNVTPKKTGVVDVRVSDLPQVPGYGIIAFYQSNESYEILAATQGALSLEPEYIEPNYYEEEPDEDPDTETIDNFSASITKY